MIVALVIGRKGSKGFPEKNTSLVLGNQLAWYPMITAKKVTKINKVYLSTDDPKLVKIAKSLDIEIINRPKHLASDKALGEDAFKHGYEEILKRENNTIELMVLLFCNSATVSLKSINKGISILNKNSFFDSAVTVSRYNMWSPIRARKLSNDGSLEPFVPFGAYDNSKEINCDRDGMGDIWFADMGCSIIRPCCLEKLDSGLLPHRWMGKKIAPIYQEAGFDVDYEWQIPLLEWWIKKYWDVKVD